MNRLDRYLIRQLAIAFVFATLAVSFVVLFSQMFRLLALVIDNSGTLVVFFKLMALTIPAFLPIVLPLAFGTATLFVYHKLASDSELIVMRTAGISPMRQARPALILAGIVMVLCGSLTLWVTPNANKALVALQTEVRDGYAVFLSRPGYFNDITDGLTFYARRRGSGGALEGILIHDVRKPEVPVTTMAATGQVLDNNGQPQIVIFSGRRQEMDLATGKLSELAFDQYVLDLNALRTASSPRLPDAREQTVSQLLHPSEQMLKFRATREHLLAELHQRLAIPLLVVSYALIGLAAILAGEFNRRGLTQRVLAAVAAFVVTQATFMSMSGMIAHRIWMAFMLYLVAAAPIMVCISLLNFDALRHCPQPMPRRAEAPTP
jgi:lipopolysaccharide export system permease protein